MDFRFEMFGRYLAVYDDNKWVGSVGNGIGFSNEYAVGYGFSEAYWGKGVATIALKKWLELNSDLTCIQAIVACNNIASQRVLEKCGFIKVSYKPNYFFNTNFRYELKREFKKVA